MKIININENETLLDIEEFELAHYGLTDLVGTDMKIKDVEILLSKPLVKGPKSLEFFENDKVRLIRSDCAFKMIFNAVFEKYKDDNEMLIRLE